MNEAKLNADTLEAFTRRVSKDWGSAHIVALAYIGDQLGIFKAMVNAGPLTSVALAERTGLNERYLREWAAAMAAAEYIEYDPEHRTFSITPEGALVLAEDERPEFLGGGFQYAQACVQCVPELIDAFKNGGGVSFSQFGPEISKAIERLFAPTYAQDVASSWIPALGELHERIQVGAKVAEVGCGGGQALVPFAEAFPNSQFIGYDVDDTSIQRARERAAKAGVADRVSFELIPAEEIPYTEHFDLICAFNCVHDMVNPRGALAGMQQAIKPDGALLWSEANVSDRIEDNIGIQGKLLYGTSTMHCMTVSLAHNGEGLGNVVGVETARGLALEAGFEYFKRLDIEHPMQQLFLATKA